MSGDFDKLVADAADAAKAMEGWDFSYVGGRRHTDRHPWDYAQVVCSKLDGVSDMLDMDTGGGEVLLSIKERAMTWPKRVCAIEGYEPNVAVATRNLAGMGAQVIECRSNGRLPFEECSFDLVTNRHGDLRPDEIYRVLRPGGAFVTQQISFSDKVSICMLLGSPEPEFATTGFGALVSWFREAGFEIEKRADFHGKDQFDDIGALVYVLTAAPWEVREFSVERYRQELIGIHDSIQSAGPLDLGIGFLLLVARKP